VNLNKKYIIWLVLCFYSTAAFAGGYIKKGEVFVAQEDVRYFTYTEALTLYQERQQLENFKKQIALLKAIIADQDKAIEKYRIAADLDKEAIQSYKQAAAKDAAAIMHYRQSIDELQNSVNETKKESKIYQVVITKQTEALKNALVSIGHQKSKRRFERKLFYWAGVLTPFVIGAVIKNIK